MVQNEPLELTCSEIDDTPHPVSSDTEEPDAEQLEYLKYIFGKYQYASLSG